VAHQRVGDLAAWLTAIIDTEPRPRVIAFGELHARTDRPVARSALARFTALVPALAARTSDLVIETWIPDPRCGRDGAAASRRVDTALRRPATTQDELGALATAARQAGIQPHALRLSCADQRRIAPVGGELDAERLLAVMTRELARVTSSAVRHRARPARPGAGPARSLVAVYGGALHNDLEPYASVAAWSIGPELDALTAGRYLEIDLYVPEYAELDALARTEPWFPLLADAGDHAIVVERRPRSFLVILPRSR
jgi:hypothetical protein